MQATPYEIGRGTGLGPGAEHRPGVFPVEGRQESGWQFDFQNLYRKSGSVARCYDFAADLRALVARQALSGYRRLGIEYLSTAPAPLLTFRPEHPVSPTARG